jgi:hypothetical protein
MRYVVLLGLISLAFVACSPTAVLERLPQAVQSHLPFSSPATAPSGETGSAPDASVQAAIQLVIQRGNFQQEQAIAARDASLMRDTSTDSYYRELVQTNASLLDGGVNRIHLDALDWGPITVAGTTATATTDETWTQEFSDGRTAQARDRNVYHLVQQGGAWKIQSDDHPDSASAGVSPTPQPGRRAQPDNQTPAPASEDAQAAVKDVIQRANEAQAQALAAADPSGMRDTATDRYYQEMQRVNQNLLDQGVSAIHLDNIEWGPITVTGDSARATAWETWTTTRKDGTSDQARDRNEYRLTRQGSTWKIQADDHPGDSGPRLPPGTQV